MRLPALRLAAVLAVSLLGACGPVDDGQAENEDISASGLGTAEMKILQFNLTHNDTAWNDAISDIQSWGGPVIATLQEVCYDSQFKPLLDQKGGDWVMSFHHQKGRLAPQGQAQDQANKACPKDAADNGGKAAYGNAVIYSKLGNGAPGVKVWAESFGASAPMNWGMACASFPWKSIEVTACSTHLVVGDPERRAKQTKAIHEIMRAERNKGRYPIVGGDFNASPSKNEMDWMYRHNGKGLFCEAAGECNSRDGAPTSKSGAKLDYVFAGKGRFVSATLNLVNAKSDHDKLKAKVEVNLASGIEAKEAAEEAAEATAACPDNDNDCWRAVLQPWTQYETPKPSKDDPRLDRRVFDAKFYLRTHADLGAKGLKNFEYAEWHWLEHGIAEGRTASPTFDPQYYMSIYGDLQAAFGPTNYAAGLDHFLAHGIAEGRRGSLLFDAPYYLARYGDLQAAFGPSHYAAAITHFHDNGMTEGRQGSADFAPAYYLASNPDVGEAYGETFFRGGMIHYLAWGRSEGRRPVP